MAAFFFYGTLCHPPLLAAVLGRAAALQPAALPGHASHWAEGHAFPVIVAASGAAAEGMLALDITPEEAARLDYYEGGFAYAEHEVTVEAGGHALRARVYLPEAPFAPAAPWSLADWAARMGAAAVLAARAFMAGYGSVPPEAAWRRYPSLLASAAAALRAEEAAPTALRYRAAPQDVALLSRAEPYAAFFSVEELDLRHRRFDGAMSPEIRRAVFVSGDAAVVLPYDPHRDRVLLIEQFRAGPFGRGDPQPWMLEAPAGRIDPGETPEEAARREAEEEAGVSLGRLEPVADYYPTPGTLTEYLYTYVGLADLPDAAAGLGGLAEEHEDIRIHILPFARLMQLVATGEVQIGPLLILAYWLAAHRARLRAEAGVLPGA